MKTEIAVFGGGCFWCVETVFLNVKGVFRVTSGYAGGTKADPSGGEVYSGTTGHAEVVKIEFDPTVVAYQKLLEVFFFIHNPTTLNQQGPDVGTCYRSIILYTTDGQKKEAETIKKQLEEAGIKPITTEIRKLNMFYSAESYHQKFYEKNQNSTYCNLMIVPKMEKFKRKFPDLLK